MRSKVRHRERINRKAREERANETPIERAYRLEMRAIYRERYKQRKARRELLGLFQIRVARLRSIVYGQLG